MGCRYGEGGGGRGRARSSSPRSITSFFWLSRIALDRESKSMDDLVCVCVCVCMCVCVCVFVRRLTHHRAHPRRSLPANSHLDVAIAAIKELLFCYSSPQFALHLKQPQVNCQDFRSSCVIREG